LSVLLLRALAGNPVHQIFPPDLVGISMGEKVQAWNEGTTLFLAALFLLSCLSSALSWRRHVEIVRTQPSTTRQ